MPEASPSDPPGIVPDDLPKDSVFAAPIEVFRLVARDPEALGDGRFRVAFKGAVRDANGRRCPEIAVEARIEGPERTGDGTAWTDMLGAFEFQMEGPPGAYRFAITDVAGGALGFDRGGPGLTASVEA